MTETSNTPMPRLTIIVVSYNTRQITLDCLTSIYAQTHEIDFELIVVDNASSDGSADAIAEAFPQADLLRSAENLGFARANNIAATRARGEYLLLLNPDTVVLDQSIDRLMRFAITQPDAMIWGARTLFPDNRLNPYSCWRDQSLWTLFCRLTGVTRLAPESNLWNPEVYGGWLRDTEREVDIVVGCVFLIPRAFWERLGGFDLRFVMYAEEADLCLRARALGARPRLTPSAEFVHYGAASDTVRADKTVRVIKAKMTLILKHWQGPRRWLGIWLMALWPWSRQLLERLRGRPGEWSEIWARRKEWMKGYPPLPESSAEPGGVVS